MAKILVVEDDPQLVLTYSILLKKEKHEVRQAFNGLEALEVLKTFKPEIILLDIRMPKMDGIEFLRAARLQQEHPEIKIVIFSNMEQAEQLEEAAALGAHRQVLKSSLSPTQLAALISDTVGV